MRNTFVKQKDRNAIETPRTCHTCERRALALRQLWCTQPPAAGRRRPTLRALNRMGISIAKEQQVLRLRALGFTYPEVAHSAGVSARTAWRICTDERPRTAFAGGVNPWTRRDVSTSPPIAPPVVKSAPQVRRTAVKPTDTQLLDFMEANPQMTLRRHATTWSYSPASSYDMDRAPTVRKAVAAQWIIAPKSIAACAHR